MQEILSIVTFQNLKHILKTYLTLRKEDQVNDCLNISLYNASDDCFTHYEVSGSHKLQPFQPGDKQYWLNIHNTYRA